MIVKFINSRLQSSVFENIINHSECVNSKYIKQNGQIATTPDQNYYISNKIPFTGDISCNNFFTSKSEESLIIATAVVMKNSDDSIVRVIQFRDDNQWKGVAPNIVWNEETDTDTYIILGCIMRKSVLYKLKDWKATYGTFMFEKYLI